MRSARFSFFVHALAIQKLRYEVVFATSGSATVGDSGWPHALDCNCVV